MGWLGWVILSAIMLLAVALFYLRKAKGKTLSCRLCVKRQRKCTVDGSSPQPASTRRIGPRGPRPGQCLDIAASPLHQQFSGAESWFSARP